MKPFYINADTKNRTHIEEPIVTQNDDVLFILKITDDGEPYDYTGVTTFALTSYRPDFESVFSVGEQVGDEVKFKITGSHLAVPGRVKASIQMYYADGRSSTLRFTYEVDPDLTVDYKPSEHEKTLIELVLVEGPKVIQAAKDATIAVNDKLEILDARLQEDWTGPEGPKGATGETGEQGEKGATGEIGPEGPEGPQGTTGETGEQGEKGDPGLDGKDGTSFTVDATGTLAERSQHDGSPDGFSFLDTEKGNLYIRQNSGWSNAIPFGKGDEGEQGPQGEQGEKGDPGEKGDTGAKGADGTSFTVDATGTLIERDQYDDSPDGFSFLDTEKGNLYIRQNSTWSNSIPFGKGEVGPQGPIGPPGEVGPKGDPGAIEDIFINVKDFGAVGDGVVDDTAAVKSAIAYAETKEGSTLQFPHAVSYLVTEPIIFPTTISVKMDAHIRYAGPANTVAITIGDAATTIFNKTYEIRVRKSTQSDWSSEGSIGVQAINLDSSQLNAIDIQHFTIGLQTIGYKGFAYSTINLGRLVNNKIALDVTSDGTGWCNDNIFNNGRITVQSTVHLDKSRYGIRVTAKNDYRQNNNIFNKPAIEMGTPTTGESIAILVEKGILNKFKDIRSEGNNLTIARFTNDSTKNQISTGYSSILANIEDLSTRGGNILENTQVMDSGTFKDVYSVPNLHKKATPYDTANPTRNHVAGLLGKSNSGTSNLRHVSNSIIQSDHLEITNNTIGVFVTTDKVKEFIIGGERLAGFGGRAVVVCYDAAGVQLTNAKAYVTALENMTMNYSANSGGRYQVSSDREESVYFKVHDDVKKIYVGFASGSGPLKIRSFLLRALFDNFTPSVDISPNRSFDERLALNQPPPDLFSQGDFVRNDAPIELGEVGSEYTVTGWTCVVGGVSGKWIENKAYKNASSGGGSGGGSYGRKVYDYEILATDAGQTVFPIPLETFDPITDVMSVVQQRTPLSPISDYSFVTSTSGLSLKLTEGVVIGTELNLRIWKEVLVDTGDTISGNVITPGTMPMDRVIDLQTEIDKLGDLTKLTTTEKVDLVKALNEINAKPSGGIIERGGYSASSYTKFPDGTLICVMVAQNMTYKGTELYSGTFYFPHEYSEAPNIFPVKNGYNSTYNWNRTSYSLTKGTTTTLNCEVSALANTGTTLPQTTLTVDILAIGRWK